jgi:hypothetical protein
MDGYRDFLLANDGSRVAVLEKIDSTEGIVVMVLR